MIAPIGRRQCRFITSLGDSVPPPDFLLSICLLLHLSDYFVYLVIWIRDKRKEERHGNVIVGPFKLKYILTMQCHHVHKDISFSPDVDICSSNPCENDGICNINHATNYICSCKSGYMGTHCESKFKFPHWDTISISKINDCTT